MNALGMNIPFWRHAYESVSPWTCTGWISLYNCVLHNFLPKEHSKESAYFLLLGKDVYTPLVHLVNPKLRYVINKSILALDTLQDIYVLTIHNIKLSRETHKKTKFSTYPVPKFNVGDKVLIRNQARDYGTWNMNVAYHVVWVITWRELE